MESGLENMGERAYYMDDLQGIKYGKDGEYDTVPIVIPTLCRYEHFVRCIESLKKNEYAQYTDIYIVIDYPVTEAQREGHDKIEKYVSQLSGFRKVIVISHEHNLGPAMNFAQIMRQLENDGKRRYIFTEDDNEFSPNFLEYINTTMNYYDRDETVVAVSGYNYPILEGLDGDIYSSNIYFSAFGYGTWIERQKKMDMACNSANFERYYRDRRRMMTLYSKSKNQFCNFVKGYTGYTSDMLRNNEVLPVDLSHGLHMFFAGQKMVFPVKSKVRNWGYDGSGVHCAKIDFDNSERANHRKYDYSKQEIDTKSTFDITKAKVCTNEKQIKELYDSFFINSFREVFLSRMIYEISILIGTPRTRKIITKLKTRHIK